MSTLKDGGPAFPRPYSINNVTSSLADGDDPVWAQEGMSLRDYFAGQVLAALISSAPNLPGVRMMRVQTAYDYADAMLKARE